MTHPRVWHLTVAYFAWAAGQYTMIFWMPQLVKNSSSQYSNTTVGVLVMIPYVAALIAMISVAYRSDRTLERRYHAAIPVMIAGTSLVLLGATSTPAFVSLIFCEDFRRLPGLRLSTRLEISVGSLALTLWEQSTSRLGGFTADLLSRVSRSTHQQC